MFKLINVSPNAHIVRIVGPEQYRSLYFSYETLIAIEYGHRRIRARNIWSRTTGKHFSVLGCKDFDVVEPDELSRIAGEVFGIAVPSSQTA